MNRNLENIPLNKICSESSSGSPREFIENDIDDLKQSIRSLGLVEPIVVYYNSATGCYEVLSGYRRLNAYVALNEDNANDGYDAIPSIVVDEPEAEDRKKAISLAEGLQQIPLTNADAAKFVADLFDTFSDFNVVQERTGLTKHMIKKFVRLSRLPERLVQAINEGEISPNTKAAENAAIEAVDLLNWQKDGDVQVEDVLKIAKMLVQEKIKFENDRIVSDTKTRSYKIVLGDELDKKLRHAANQNGTSPEELITDSIESSLSEILD